MAFSAYKAFKHPEEGEHISTLGELSSYGCLLEMQERMQASPSGRKILEEKPRVRAPLVEVD